MCVTFTRNTTSRTCADNLQLLDLASSACAAAGFGQLELDQFVSERFVTVDRLYRQVHLHRAAVFVIVLHLVYPDLFAGKWRVRYLIYLYQLKK